MSDVGTQWQLEVDRNLWPAMVATLNGVFLKMPLVTGVTRYLSNMPNGKLVLWCYLIWYLGTLLHHFDPAPGIWLNSIGISALIGVALVLSVGGAKSALGDRWQTFRLFAMPFCVSSFSSLIKGKGFILVFPPSASEMAITVALCATFTVIVIGLRKTGRTASV